MTTRLPSGVVAEHGAVVTALWRLVIANSLTVAARLGRCTSFGVLCSAILRYWRSRRIGSPKRKLMSRGCGVCAVRSYGWRGSRTSSTHRVSLSSGHGSTAMNAGHCRSESLRFAHLSRRALLPTPKICSDNRDHLAPHPAIVSGDVGCPRPTSLFSHQPDSVSFCFLRISVTTKSGPPCNVE
jgi:hypothetical protein